MAARLPFSAERSRHASHSAEGRGAWGERPWRGGRWGWTRVLATGPRATWEAEGAAEAGAAQLWSSGQAAAGPGAGPVAPQQQAERGAWRFGDQAMREHSGGRGLNLGAPPPSQAGGPEGSGRG